MAKVKLEEYHDLSSLRSVEDKIIMFKETPVLFTNLRITQEEERYGRKKNKVREVKYINADVYGYNRNGEFLGIFDSDFVKHLLLMYDLLKMRKNYLEFIKGLELIQNKEAELNEPDIVKAIP